MSDTCIEPVAPDEAIPAIFAVAIVAFELSAKFDVPVPFVIANVPQSNVALPLTVKLLIAPIAIVVPNVKLESICKVFVADPSPTIQLIGPLTFISEPVKFKV